MCLSTKALSTSNCTNCYSFHNCIVLLLPCSHYAILSTLLQSFQFSAASTKIIVISLSLSLTLPLSECFAYELLTLNKQVLKFKTTKMIKKMKWNKKSKEMTICSWVSCSLLSKFEYISWLVSYNARGKWEKEK